MQTDICDSIADGLLNCYSQQGSSGLEAFASKITSSNEGLLLNEDNISRLRTSTGGSLLSKYLIALLTIAVFRLDKLYELEDENQSFKQPKKVANDFLAKVFLKAIMEMNAGNITHDGPVYQFLFEHIDYLSEDAAHTVAEGVVQSFSRTKDMESNANGSRSVLDFLGPLCNRGGETLRNHILGVLESIDWRQYPVLLANSFVECCVCENDCKAAIQKIKEVINYSLEKLLYWRHGDDKLTVHLCARVEELPQLLHQLTLLGNKLHVGLSTESSSQILDIFSMTIDCLLTLYFNDRLKHSEKSKIQHVCYMLFESMAVTFAKDQSLCQQVIHMLKHRCLYSTSKFFVEYVQTKMKSHDSSSLAVSVGKLILVFIVGRSTREATKVSSELFTFMSEIYDIKNRMNNSLWFQSEVWKCPNGQITSNSLKVAFELLLAGPLMFQGISSPIIQIGFALIDACELPVSGGLEKVTSSIVHCVPSKVSSESQVGVEHFGKWLLLKLFCEYDDEDSRKNIIGEVIIRLVSASNISSFHPTTKGSCKSEILIASHCVDVLKNSIEVCGMERLLKMSNELQEMFLHATKLTPDLAKTLMTIFYSVFNNVPGMSDRCSIALRKACFSRDNASRLAAVSSILALLRCHLQTAVAKASLECSQSSTNIHVSQTFRISMKDNVLSGFSVEEIMVLLRRFLRYQRSVRLIIYEELHEISTDIAEFRPLALRMLRTHFLDFFVKHGEGEDGAEDVFSKNSAAPSTIPCAKLNVDKFVDEFGRHQENCVELITTILSILQMECSPEEIGIDLFSYFSQGSALETMSFSQNEFLVQNREGHFCCELLWSFVNSMATTDVETICPIVPHSQSDVDKLEVTFTAYYSAMIVTVMFPVSSVSEDMRFTMFHSLLQKSKICVDVANKFLRNNSGKLGKPAKRSRPQPSHTDQNHVNVNPQSTCYGGDGKYGNSMTTTFDAGIGKFTVLAEMKFISKLLNLASLFDLQQNETESSNKVLHSDFLGGLLLERAVICIEKAIAHLQKNLMEEFSATVIAIVGSLYPSMLRYMMFVRKGNIVDDGRRSNPLLFLSLPILNSASLLQLLFRGLLGCVKILLSSGGEEKNVDTLVAHLLHMLDSRSLNSTSVDGGMSFTDIAKVDELTASSNKLTCIKTIEEATLFNIELLTALQSKHHKDADKLEACLLVSLIGEFFKCLTIIRDTIRDPRTMITNKIIEDCSKYLQRPSESVTSTLVRFLILQAPVNPSDRLNKAALISSWMKDCISHIDIQMADYLRDNDGDFDESNDFSFACEVFGVLSTETLCSGVSTLVAILDKALIEAFTLLRIFNQYNSRTIANGFREGQNKTVLYQVIRKFAEIISPLFSASIGCDSLEKVLTFSTRYYKFLVAIIKDSTQKRGDKKTLSVPLKEMITIVSQVLSSNIYEYLNESEQNEQKLRLFSISKRGKRRESSMSTIASKLDKIIPDLIFQMEQFDVNLLKLSNRVVTERSYLTKLVKSTNPRDFRLKLGSAKHE